MTDCGRVKVIRQQAFVVIACVTLVGVAILQPRSGFEHKPFNRVMLDPTKTTRAEWTLIPGIGPNLATRLHEAKVRGDFATADRFQAMDDVHGIGEVLLGRMGQYVDLGAEPRGQE
jgi:hypothetical protein